MWKNWEEVVAITCYLIDKSRSSALNFKMPMELWQKSPPQLNHLRHFVCLAYIHVSQEKLNPRALKVIFFGYHIGTKSKRGIGGLNCGFIG